MLLVAIGMLLMVAPTAGASCAAPSVSVSPSSVVAGKALLITGREWRAACSDSPGAAPDQPAKRITLSLEQPGTSTALGTVAADAQRSFTLSVALPRSARPGRAVIVADDGGVNRAEQVITVLPRPRVLPVTGTNARDLVALTVLTLGTGLGLRRFAARGGGT